LNRQTAELAHDITYIMAPKRRASDRTASASRQQSTLSFNGKNTRVTKTSHQSLQNGKNLGAEKKEIILDEALSRASSAQPEDVAEKPKDTTTNKATKQHDDAEVEILTGGSKVEDVLGGRAQTSDVGAVGGPVSSGWVSDEEARARKMSEAQIKKFWREQESLRLVPRVHQEDLDVHERVLRLWDVSNTYGVSFSFPVPSRKVSRSLFADNLT
jgi:DNA polymerase delta subunit 4